MISFIIPTHTGDLIKDCLNSITWSDFYEPYETIVMAGEGMPAKKRNDAVKKAKGNYLCFLDDDVVLDSNAVWYMLQAMKYCDFVFGKLLNAEQPDRLDDAGAFLTWTGFLWSRAGQLDKDVGQYDTAEAKFKKALEYDPKNKDAHKELGILYFKQMEKNIASGKGRGINKTNLALNELQYWTSPGSKEFMDVAGKYMRMAPTTVVAAYIWACTNKQPDLGWRLWAKNSREKHFKNKNALEFKMKQTGSKLKSFLGGKISPKIEDLSGKKKRVHLKMSNNAYVDVIKLPKGWFIAGGSNDIVKIATK